MMENSFNIYKERCKIIEENLNHINYRIEKAAIQSGRKSEDIKLLAATKTVETEYVNFAISKGINLIGENRVQELLSKYNDINKEETEIHFIGHLQTNKVKDVIDKVSVIQSVDSVKLAKEISNHAIKQNKVMKVLIEINIGSEKSKGGVLKENIIETIEKISNTDRIEICGLMAIPPICKNKFESSKYFEEIFEIGFDIKSKNIDNVHIDFLSMGMSRDYEEAILNGANIVRIGSALFGERKTK